MSLVWIVLLVLLAVAAPVRAGKYLSVDFVDFLFCRILSAYFVNVRHINHFKSFFY